MKAWKSESPKELPKIEMKYVVAERVWLLQGAGSGDKEGRVYGT